MKRIKNRSGRARAGRRSGVAAEVRLVPIHEITPSPENDKLYDPPDADASAFAALVESIGQKGILEPIVVTADGYILSGHRRHAAALRLKLREVPVREESMRRADDLDVFVQRLRHHNMQRVKTTAERLREETVSAEVSSPWQSLVEHREAVAETLSSTIDVSNPRSRPLISNAKLPFLKAVIEIVFKYRDCWPISDRFIHYRLVSLREPPLRHGSKPRSRYRNNVLCYNDLTDLLTRGRIENYIPMEAIGDETRPVTILRAYREPAAFMRDQLGSILKGYTRDLMQSQPNHIELLVEKNTIAPIIRPVAMAFGIPMTSGRGYCSLPPLRDMKIRFTQSGKRKFILLVVSDFDPDGEQIAESAATVLYRDFRVPSICAHKIALTKQQVDARKLPPDMLAKEGAASYQKFVQKYGQEVFELEAIEPDELQEIVRNEITRVIDVEAYNAEIDRERADEKALDSKREVISKAIRDTLGQMGPAE